MVCQEKIDIVPRRSHVQSDRPKFFFKCINSIVPRQTINAPLKTPIHDFVVNIWVWSQVPIDRYNVVRVAKFQIYTIKKFFKSRGTSSDLSVAAWCSVHMLCTQMSSPSKPLARTK